MYSGIWCTSSEVTAGVYILPASESSVPLTRKYFQWGQMGHTGSPLVGLWLAGWLAGAFVCLFYGAALQSILEVRA